MYIASRSTLYLLSPRLCFFIVLKCDLSLFTDELGVIMRTEQPTKCFGYGVNSYSSQFVLKSIRTHFGQFVLSFRSIRTNLIKFSQLVLILVDSYSVWSIRTHIKNMILIVYIILLMIDR